MLLLPRVLFTIALLLATEVSGAARTDVKTGLVLAPGFEVVSTQCTVCHSASLISQNRADREGWLEMIRWMQKTQGLWPLGGNEELVLDYLAANYGPVAKGRRARLRDEFLPPR